MTKIHDFTKEFTQLLKELVDATSDIARPHLHPLLKEPGLAIGCSDSTGKSVLELRSKSYAEKTLIPINGKMIPFQGPEDPTKYAIVTSTTKTQIERVLFPYVPDEPLRPTIKMNKQNVSFHNFCFSTPEYKKKYWDEINRVPLSGEFNVPFEVTQEGLLIVQNILHGLEIDGNRHERYIEFAMIFGSSSLIPAGKTNLREMAFAAFSSLVTGKDIRPECGFGDFLKTLETPVKQNVLLLGSYNSEQDEEDFNKLKSCLSSFGYSGFMLKDSQDLPIQSNTEKLLAAIMYSCFVIVLDSQPSGHIAELENLLSLKLRPVIIVRHKDAKPSTYFLEDRIDSDDNFRIADVSDISSSELLVHIKWAKEKTDKQIDCYNEINSWRDS